MSLTQFNQFTKWITEESKTKLINKDLIQLWNNLLEQVRGELTKYSPDSLYHSLPFNKNPNIILTMTTCKRYNLFEQTINSIINTWTDLQLVDQFIVIDDNSSYLDRTKMSDNYKFIKYIMKTNEQKGHLESMNMIYNILESERPKYWIHMEDDFLFFNTMPYISLGLQGLDELFHFNVKQVMFNRNYAETLEQINMTGHIPYIDNTFSLHNYKPGGYQCQYWPHFSFRPSIIDAATILKLGNFTCNHIFFENEYAKKWTDNNYKTAFINTITNIHIGKICNTEGVNAYSLNNVPQFNGQSELQDFNIKVINMYNRQDRLNIINKQLKNENLYFQRIEAIDGKLLKLTPELLKLFQGNDFGYRRGVIGCALSHYYLWKDLVNSDDLYYVIMEDDVKLCNNFTDKLSWLLHEFNNNSDYNLIFAGYHMLPEDRNTYKDIYNIDTENVVIEPIKTNLYIGGTHCYIISKKGAQSLLDFIEINGIKHGIDYLMVKVQKTLPVYETMPHIAFADWVTNSNSIVDSDIQYDNNAVEVDYSDKYLFFKGLDQIGNDCFICNREIPKEKYYTIANSITNCIAFNTLGFFKNSISNLVASPYFKEDDGIYINKDYYLNFKKKE